MAEAAASVTLGAQGRLVLPARFRKALHLTPGDRLLVRIVGEHLVVEGTDAVERRVHARFRNAAGRSLAAELIEERRWETAGRESEP